MYVFVLLVSLFFFPCRENIDCLSYGNPILIHHDLTVFFSLNFDVLKLDISYRSGPSDGINKSDGVSLLAGSSTRITLKNDVDKGSLSKDLSAALNKERLISKGNNKYVFNHVISIDLYIAQTSLRSVCSRAYVV